MNMASRNLSDLLPHVQEKVREGLDRCQLRGIEPLIYCTYRSPEEQNALYAQGRTIPGRIVTDAPGGKSWHQWRRAFDVVPLLHGKPLWVYRPTDPHWSQLIDIFEACGFEWAGRWTAPDGTTRKVREFVHFQLTDGHKLSEMPG